MTPDLVKAWAEVVKSVAWPVVVALAVWWLRHSILRLLGRTTQINVKFFGHEVALQAGDGARDLKQLLQEVQETVAGLSDEHRMIFQCVRAADGRRKVEDLFPGFQRDTREHLLLQELRDRQLLRPFEGGSWRAEKHPVLTRFATLVLRTNPNYLDPRMPNREL